MLIYRQKITKDSICKSHVTGSLEYSVYFLAKKANKTITVWFSSRMSNLSTLILFLIKGLLYGGAITESQIPTAISKRHLQVVLRDSNVFDSPNTNKDTSDKIFVQDAYNFLPQFLFGFITKGCKFARPEITHLKQTQQSVHYSSYYTIICYLILLV